MGRRRSMKNVVNLKPVGTLTEVLSLPFNIYSKEETLQLIERAGGEEKFIDTVVNFYHLTADRFLRLNDVTDTQYAMHLSIYVFNIRVWVDNMVKYYMTNDPTYIRLMDASVGHILHFNKVFGFYPNTDEIKKKSEAELDNFVKDFEGGRI